MIRIDRTRTPADLVAKIDRLFELSAGKMRSIERRSQPGDGAPVFTIDGRYTARGWTEWTEGFQYGSSLLQFDATGEREFLELGRERTLTRMAPHVGVHDHGFNNVSTYGALWRMALEGRIDASEWERRFYALALKVSGAVQARRWTTLAGGGYIYSFNGAHSLFVDTIRSLRALALSHLLGHRLVEEQDAQVNLLVRLVQHARATAAYNVFYGKSDGPFDVRGRVAHESLFNVANGTYRGPSTQQGYSPFSTWTRGLAWAMLGFAEQLEFLSTLTADARRESGAAESEPALLDAARATCDFYVESAACADGIPYWDTGAPGLSALGDWGSRASEPFNDREPVDSSAAAIAAQGLLRFGRFLQQRSACGRGERAERVEPQRAGVGPREPLSEEDGSRYTQAGLRVLDTLFDDAGPYLSRDPEHQGLLLHSVYHWPNGWDHVPAGANVPRGESSQWGDYHAREAAVYVKRLAENGPYLAFFGPGG
jgi:unsaturated chondroitin disaccharide hydrolase